MDPNAGKFVEEAEAKTYMKRFEIGEVLKVKGEEFEVIEIHERKLILKPMSAQDRITRNLRKEFGDPINRAERRRLEAIARKGKR